MSPYIAAGALRQTGRGPVYEGHLANDVVAGQRFWDRIFSTPVDNSVENLPGVRRFASEACTAGIGGGVPRAASAVTPVAVRGRAVIRVIHRTAMAFRAVKGKQVTFRSACKPLGWPESGPSGRYGNASDAGEVHP